MKVPEVEDLSFLQKENFYQNVLKIILSSENFLDPKIQKEYNKSKTGKKI